MASYPLEQVDGEMVFVTTALSLGTQKDLSDPCKTHAMRNEFDL
jgi:hypothetical protein